MKPVQKIKAISPFPTNGVKEFKQTKADVQEVLQHARRVNVAAWDLVIEGADEAFGIIEEVATTSKDVRGAWGELREAWTELAQAAASLRRRWEPETPTTTE